MHDGLASSDIHGSAPAAKASAGDGDEGAQPKGQALQAAPDVVAAHCGQAPASGSVTAGTRRALPEVA